MSGKKRITRREFIRWAGLAAAGLTGAAALGSCAQPTPQVIEKEKIVTKEVEKVVTATPAPEEIELTFFNWASAEEATRKNIEALMAEFQKQNPGVKFKNVQFGFGDIQNQTLIAITGGNPPDIVQQSSNMPFELAAMGALEPLDDYVSKEYLDDNWPGALAAGTWDGKLYALPWIITPHAFWYNKKLMAELGLDPEKPPSTIDELNAACEVAKAKDIYGMGLDTTKRQYALVHQWPWKLAFGAEPYKDGKPNFNTPEMEEYYEWLRFFVTEKQYSPPAPAILRDFRQFSAQGTEVFAWDGPYFKGILQSINPDLQDEQVFQETWAVKGIPVKRGTPRTVMDIHQLVITKACKHKEMAWKFVKFLASSDLAVERYMIPLGAIPPAKSLIEKFKDHFSDPISQAYINEIIPSGVPMP
ncbi:MAG: sugar ABC transporter substrate-binding protein, partial [Anaerolineae bacterium]|nr:sugar ABC transporter substrate-binding protein [Anaerolineae bacterium]